VRRAQIGENRIEQQGTESSRSNGKSEGGQCKAGRRGRVAGVELSASEADLAAVSAGWGEGAAAWQLWEAFQSCIRRAFQGAVLRRMQERYADFGATLAAEHLGRDDGLQVHAETLRHWMKRAGLWREQRRRKPYRQRREPKAHFGELVQLDGSFHHWLEQRAARACLMHMADDATSAALARFEEEETTWGAARLLRAWIERYGVPRALYTDWKNVYVRVPNAEERRCGQPALTQFGRMCQKLGIRIIVARSPQAKGRIERAHGTHQYRLVKKLRLAGIATYSEANRLNPRLSPTTTDGAAIRRGVLVGGGTGGE
jgi:hypothetical protein